MPKTRARLLVFLRILPREWKVALLIAFSMIALLIVSALLWKNSHRLTTTGIGLALILGGAIGNLWDRLVSRHVVDFLLFYVGPHQWPAFNVADSAIVVGAGLLVFEIVFTKVAQPTVGLEASICPALPR